MLDPDFLAAIGHPVRLQALVLFERGPAAVRELADAAGLSPSAAAYHVRRLADAGLIDEAGARDGERLWRVRATGWDALQSLLRETASGPDAGT